LPISGRPVRLVWRKRRWRCRDADCDRASFTESNSLIGGSLTERTRAEICRLVGEEGRPVASVARSFGVGWATAMTAVRDHGEPVVEAAAGLGRTRALGVDEHKMLAAGPRHHTIYATQLVDLDTGRLLDVVPGRSAKSVTSWVERQGGDTRAKVVVAAIDPHAGYAKALRTSLPSAAITVDPFHLIKLANACIDEVRRRVQRETLGHRGRKDDPLYGIRRLLTRGYERLSDRQEARMFEGLRTGDLYDEVGGALACKEQLRAMYAAGTLSKARRELATFHRLAKTTGTPEVLRLSRTVRRWEREILSFFTTGHTNAKSEARNLITEKVRRNAHGFRNFDNYRLRLLLHSGVEWQTVPTVRIRERHPRLVA
jgi:transposase